MSKCIRSKRFSKFLMHSNLGMLIKTLCLLIKCHATRIQSHFQGLKIKYLATKLVLKLWLCFVDWYKTVDVGSIQEPKYCSYLCKRYISRSWV